MVYEILFFSDNEDQVVDEEFESDADLQRAAQRAIKKGKCLVVKRLAECWGFNGVDQVHLFSFTFLAAKAAQ